MLNITQQYGLSLANKAHVTSNVFMFEQNTLSNQILMWNEMNSADWIPVWVEIQSPFFKFSPIFNFNFSQKSFIFYLYFLGCYDTAVVFIAVVYSYSERQVTVFLSGCLKRIMPIPIQTAFSKAKHKRAHEVTRLLNNKQHEPKMQKFHSQRFTKWKRFSSLYVIYIHFTNNMHTKKEHANRHHTTHAHTPEQGGKRIDTRHQTGLRQVTWHRPRLMCGN